jgi:hypothetical protein
MPASDGIVKHAIDTWPPIAALTLRDLYAAAEPQSSAIDDQLGPSHPAEIHK